MVSAEIPSRRRELLEEVLEARSRVVAGLPIDQQDPNPRSRLWWLGASRVAFHGYARQAAIDLAVLALAWLEAFDTQVPTDPK